LARAAQLKAYAFAASGAATIAKTAMANVQTLPYMALSLPATVGGRQS
jgi:hypothetical protein